MYDKHGIQLGEIYTTVATWRRIRNDDIINVNFDNMYRDVIQQCIWEGQDNAQTPRQMRNNKADEATPSTSKQTDTPASPESNPKQSSDDESAKTTHETTRLTREEIKRVNPRENRKRRKEEEEIQRPLSETSQQGNFSREKKRKNH